MWCAGLLKLHYTFAPLLRSPMNKNKAIFLDLFGTLIEDHGFFEKAGDIIFKKGDLEFFKKIEAKGFIIFISIFREGGEVPEMKYIKSIQNKILSVLAKHGINKKSISFLSHVDSEQPDLHPLTPVFIRTLEKKYNLDISKSIIIGDLMKDVEIGKSIGAITVLLSSPDDSPWIPDVDWLEPDFMVAKLTEAANKIEKL